MSAPAPHWLTRWLGFDSAGAGEGTVWSVDHAWNWAPWVTLLAAGAAIAGVAWFYARETGHASRPWRWFLSCLRLSAIAIVLFMIAEVVISFERTGLPYVVVAIDDSASMALVDRYDDEAVRRLLEQHTAEIEATEPSRFAVAQSLLLGQDASFLRTIHRRYKLKVVLLSETVRPLAGGIEELTTAVRAASPLGTASRLGQGLRGILNELRGTPPTAIVLLTDGVTTEGESLSDAASYAQRKGVPLFAIGVGNDAPARDIKLVDLLVDEVAFVDDLVQFEVKVAATACAGRDVRLVLRHRDSPDTLAETTVHVDSDDQTQTARLTHRPTEAGEFHYVVEATPVADELQEQNNRRQATVSVRREQIRVLLAQAYPSFEFRYLKNLLERDPTVALSTVLQEADPEYVAADKTALRVFPSRREAIFDFDVIVFGDVNPQFVSAATLETLAEFVDRKGGGLAFIAGPRYSPWSYRGSPLAGLLPVEVIDGASPEPSLALTEPFVMQPTEAGLALPPLQLGDTPEESRRIWSQLPGCYWLTPATRLKPGALALAEHPTALVAGGKPWPVISMQFVGAGRVLFHATDETWRWRYRVGDVFFARYWIQTIRYLSRAKLLGQDRTAELTTDRREYRRGENVRLRVRFLDERQAPEADDGATVMIERAGGNSQRVALRRNSLVRGVFEGDLVQPPEGDYHAWLAAPALEGRPPAADFQVIALPGELGQTRLDVAELERAARESRGKFYRATDIRRLLSDLPPGRQVPIETLPPWVLWNKWPLVLAFTMLLVVEWLVRKWCGMV